MKKVLIITDCHLPLPAVKGGAVPTLINTLLNENEKKCLYEIDVLSVYDKQAFSRGKKYHNTRFLFHRHHIIITKIDAVLTSLIRYILKRKTDSEEDIIWKVLTILKIVVILLLGKYDYIVFENAGFILKSLKVKKIRKKYKDRLYYHLHNELPSSIDDDISYNLKYILVSDYLSKKILARFPNTDRANIYILKNCVSIKKSYITETEKYNLKKSLGFDNDDIIIGFIGRIAKEKGLSQLIEAFQGIKKPNVKMLIVGATQFGNGAVSTYEREIMKIINKNSNKILATGYIPHDDISMYYQLCDLIVLPSIWNEPAGLTIIESLFNNKPTITTNVGGIPEYMSTKFGIMVDVDHNIVCNLRDCMEKMLENLEYWNIECKEASMYISKYYTEEVYFDNFSRILREN